MMLLAAFPEFNIHSTPLLILVLQGVIFAVLLILRFRDKGRHADVLIAMILLVMAYHRTTYTVGFMGWYDTFKNTKINYFLISLGLGMGPLIYLYVRSITVPPFKLKRTDIWHFVPVAIYVLYRLIILFFDSTQDGWEKGYGGVLKSNFDEVYIEPFYSILRYSSQLLYLSFTIQLFWKYRSKIRSFFSNTYEVELNWLRNFLLIYSVLFIYSQVIDIIDAFITDLHYTHRWWTDLFTAIAIVYLGMKAYMTDIGKLLHLTIDVDTVSESNPSIDHEKYRFSTQRIRDHIESTKPYLSPEYTLSDLSQELNMSIHDASQAINAGLGVNFNELINSYRVQEVKSRIQNGENEHFSLMSIGLDSGFNSKATFNRVFKRVTKMSPSEFKKSCQTG